MVKIALVSPQGQEIYSALLKQKTLTATEIARKLHIHPQAVYRAIKPLVYSGLVVTTGTYPRTFKAVSAWEAGQIYAHTVHTLFLKQFSGVSQNSDNGLHVKSSISFIQNRQELLDMSLADLAKSQKSFDLIVSGFEVPAEFVLENKRAIDRGVSIRILTQESGLDNKEMLGNWQRLGIKVRTTPTIDVRLILTDRHIVYLTSYKPDDPQLAYGIRFDYPPIARLFDEIFAEKWSRARKI